MEQIRRWYDINPLVSEAMKAWELFPPALQIALAKYIAQLMKQKQVQMRYKGLWSLIVQILLYYDNSKNNRWYDKHPILKKTVNRLSHAEAHALIDVARKISKLRTYVKEKPVDIARLSEAQLLKEIDYVFKNPNLI